MANRTSKWSQDVRAAMTYVRWFTFAVAFGISQVHAVAANSDDDVTSQSTAKQSEVAGIAEIVVTAQHRSETAQNVPISLSVIPSLEVEQLDLRTAQDLQFVTPGLDFHNAYSLFMTWIRGIGFDYTDAGLEPSVAIYIDGAYLPRGGGTTLNLLDMSTTQVLKGPQGTLYGQNATGGAIILTTADPTDKLEGHVTGEYGRFDHVQGEFVLNTPLTDTLSARFAGRVLNEDGYVRNLYDGKELGSREVEDLRAKLAYRPTADFSAILTVEYDHGRSDGPPLEERLPAPLCLGCAIKPGSGPATSFYTTNLDFTPPVLDNDTSVNLKLSGTAGIVNLQSVTAYRSIAQNNPSDQDFTSANLFDFSSYVGGKTVSEDVTATTNSHGWIDGLLGLSYFADRGYYNLAANGGAFAPIVAATDEVPFLGNTVHSHSAAEFAELTLRPIERISIIAGGRYTTTERHLDAEENLAANLGFAGLPSVLQYRTRASFSRFTPRFVVSYDAGVANVYASYNEGFKAGGFNTPAAQLGNVIQPETIKSYEAGIKFVSPDHLLNANLSAFYYTHDAVQVAVVNVATGGQSVTNAARANGKGVDFDLAYHPVDWFEISTGAAFLRTVFLEYPNASLAGPAFNPITGLATGLVNLPENLSGTVGPHAPRFTDFIATDIKTPMSDGWTGRLAVIARYSDTYDFVAGAGGPLGLDRQSPTTLVNMSGYVGPSNDKYEIGFYIDNLTNVKYAEIRQTSAGFGASQLVDKPITYGLRLRYNF